MSFLLINTFSASSSDASRGVCECDRALVNALYHEVPANTNYDTDDCIQSSGSSGGSSGPSSNGSSGGSPPGAPQHDCCNWDGYMWAFFDTAQYCCSRTGLLSVDSGAC